MAEKRKTGARKAARKTSRGATAAEPRDQQVSVLLTASEKAALAEIADRESRSLSTMARLILLDGIRRRR